MDEISKPRKGTRKKYGPRDGTAQRRQEVLDAARQVFAAKGFHAGTLGDVAALAGMSQAGVLHHFGSKEDLLRAVLDQRDNLDSSEARAAYGLDYFRHLITVAKLNESRRGIVQAYVVLSAEAATEGNPGTDYFAGRFEWLRGLVMGELRKLSPVDDPLSEPELTVAASNIIALMDGLQTQWLLNPGSFSLADATVFGIDAILCSVAAGGSRRHQVTADDALKP